MKKILGLAVAALLIMGLVGGGTWAFFSDTETSTGNTLMAGTLDLGLANATDDTSTTSTTATWTAEDWAPGDTKDATLHINNDGSIDMAVLTVAFSYDAVNTDGRPDNIAINNPEQDTDKFDKMVKATTATWGGVDVEAIKDKTLEQLKTANAITLAGGLTAGNEKALNVVFTFSDTATNGCQGNTVDVTVTVVGTQNAS